MKTRRNSTRLAALALALLMALSLAPTANASATSGMGNFKKVREYQGFSDVPDSAWYAKDVRKAYEMGLINGGSDGRFNPEGNLTVAEAVTMAVNVCTTYWGLSIEQGTTPWYQGAVDYALGDSHILYEGQFSDYSQLATRADVARMFANSLPGREFGRINRVAWIPDVTPNTSNYNYIYVLYNAGIVTGDNAGLFRPDDTISRAEAAAILNRLASSGERKHIDLTTHAPGEVITAADASFQISVPKNQGWIVRRNEMTEDGDDSVFYCKLDDSEENGSAAAFYVQAYHKQHYSSYSIKGVVESLKEQDEEEGYLIEEDIYGSWTRGINGYSYDSSYEGKGGHTFYQTSNVIENSQCFFLIILEYRDDATDEQRLKLEEMLLAFDVAI